MRERLFWGIAIAALLCVLLFQFWSAFLPFLVAILMAYWLDPLTRRLHVLGVPRTASAVLMLLLFFGVLFLFLGLVVPLLVRQLYAFAEQMPQYAQHLDQGMLENWRAQLRDLTGADLPSLKETVGKYLGQIFQGLGKFFSGVVASGQTLAGVLGLLIFTPLVTFYLLMDWPKFRGFVRDTLPVRYRALVRDIVTDVHAALSGFLRGQALVCLFLALWYGVGLSLIGLRFGWLIGLVAGLLGFIPFVGLGFGLVLALLVAAFQFGQDWVSILAVLGVFVSAQFLEGNFLSPKLVGNSVGLHPVWLMFAVYFFGSVAGFVGLLFAVPIAAVAAVFVRYGYDLYRRSAFFHGT